MNHPLVVDARVQDFDVFIMRPGKWGNDYIIGIHGTRAECIAMHRAKVLSNPVLIETIKKELRGKRLG